MTAAVAHHDRELDLGGGSKQSCEAVTSGLVVSLQTCSFEESAVHHQQPQLQQQQQQDEAGVAQRQGEESNSSSVSPVIDELPDEVLLQVASHLGVRALGAFAQVDRRLRGIAEDDALWRDMFVARFGFLPAKTPASWKLAYSDYETTPRWHSSEKHPELIVKDDGLIVTMPTPTGEGNENTDNRTIRSTIEYTPGSGLHYFEVKSLCPNDVRYHPYVGLCSTTEVVPVPKMQMWFNDGCYAYGGNGTLYSSPSLEGNHSHLGKYQYGDYIGLLVDYRDEKQGSLTFFLNKQAVSGQLRITGTWFPCVGLFHPRHAIQIVVRPQVPEVSSPFEEELPTA